MTLKQARTDLKYMQDHYGDPLDLCGAICNTEILMQVLSGDSSITDAITQVILGYERQMLHECDSELSEDKRAMQIIGRHRRSVFGGDTN